MDIIPKRASPPRVYAVESPPPGSEQTSARHCAAWIDRDLGGRPAFPSGVWDGLLLQDGDAALAEDEPAHRVRVDPDRVARVIDARTGRRLHTLGEIRLVGRVWRFTLATRANGFPAALNSAMASRLAQLDGAPMGGPRTSDALAAEISSLLGYDAHR